MDTPRFVYRGTRFKPRNSRGLRQLGCIEEPVQTIPTNRRGILCRSFPAIFPVSLHIPKRLAVEQCDRGSGNFWRALLLSLERVIFVKKIWTNNFRNLKKFLPPFFFLFSLNFSRYDERYFIQLHKIGTDRSNEREVTPLRSLRPP